MTGFAGAAASSALRGESFGDNAGQLMVDAFGNALGNVAAREMQAQHRRNLVGQMDDHQRLQALKDGQMAVDRTAYDQYEDHRRNVGIMNRVEALNTTREQQMTVDHKLYKDIEERRRNVAVMDRFDAINRERDAQMSADMQVYSKTMVRQRAERTQSAGIGGSWSWSGQCTAENPYGLSYEQAAMYGLESTRDLSVDRLGSQLELALVNSGPQLKPPMSPVLRAEQQAQAERTQSWLNPSPRDVTFQWRTAQGINDGAMLAAFRYYPGRLMAGQATYSFSNFEEPWIASGINDLYGADARFSASIKNDKLKFEAKVYSGTDVDLGASWKSGRMEFKHPETGFKGNISQHYQLKDISDFSSFSVSNIAEFDGKPLNLHSVRIGNASLKSTLTFGARVNTDTLDTRGSINYKFELPEPVRPLGWTPSVGFEIRK